MNRPAFAERYAPERSLGRGGGGEVWAAVDRATGNRVALKVLQTRAGPGEVEALIRETIALSGLEGLGFPRVLALGRAPDGRLFLVRELVDGESLEALAERDPERALRVLPALADVLTVVHRTGLLHGDVKPANAIVRESGEVALVDLGLATALGPADSAALGHTPHFAAPEVLSGGAPTVRSEVYALGIILRDLLADSRTLRTNDGARAALQGTVTRSLALSPDDRFPSADEWAEAVRAAFGAGDALVAPALARPWPVLAIDAWAYQLRERVDALAAGGEMRVVGPPGSGRSTLMRRVSWSLALAGRAVVLVDDDLAQSELLQATLRASLRPNGLVFWDASTGDLDRVRAEVRKSGARLIHVAEVEANRSDFLVPELEASSVEKLLRGALSGLPTHLVPAVIRHVGARPLALRRWVQSVGNRPLASADDIVAARDGALIEGMSPIEQAAYFLDRGHYDRVRDLLGSLPKADARALWIEARYEVAAGAAQRALVLLDEALSGPVDDGLRSRLQVTRARALLGVGRYEDATIALSRVEEYEATIRAEGLAYLGLAGTLLGRPLEAVEVLRRAEELARGTQVPRLCALTASSLATAEWKAGDPARASASFERAIAAAGEAGDAGILISAQINLAGLKKEHGDLAASIQMLEAAEDAARRAGRHGSRQQVLLNLVNADLYLGRLERARAALARVGDALALPPALQAQLSGLRAELHVRDGDFAGALREFDACADAFEKLGRPRDASEALLEAVIALSPQEARNDRSAVDSFVASEQMLSSRVQRGIQLLEGTVTPLVRLAEARLASFRGDVDKAETLAREAAHLAQEAGQREWEWRAFSLEAQLLEGAGKATRAERARRSAVEVLEEIGARLPPDLREVYWSDPRRRALRSRDQTKSAGSVVESGVHKQVAFPPRELALSSGTDAVSRLTQTPLERRLARILAINSDLASEFDLDKLATKIVAHAADLLGAERGYLLLGSTAETLEIRASRSPQSAPHKQFSRSIAGEVLRSGQPLVSIDAGQDQRLRSFESVHAGSISAVACVPVLSPLGIPVGALYLETRLGSRPDFGDELPTLQAFADQAAIALENARLLAELAEKRQVLEQQNARLFETQERLKELLGRRTARLKEVRSELRSARGMLAIPGGFRGLVGTSSAMRRIYALIERVQETDVPVLITGESGTGKEVVARAIHEGSLRRQHPLIAVNCGAIPETILESELFGHKRGAFTGAERDRKGLFLEASHGTLLLDEVGETPLKMQASLLRVLQEQRVRPVGGSDEVPIDVRVIFATNRDLMAAVEQGKFREDLLYRIQVVEISLPPLRERREDIALLVDHFLGRFAVRFGQEKKALSREALHLLQHHPLPGNVRQLENVLLNAWVLSEGSEIGEQDVQLPPAVHLRPSGREDSSKSISSRPHVYEPNARSAAPSSNGSAPRSGSSLDNHQLSERRQIVEALERTGWNRVRAAELLEMPRRTFYRRLREYGIQ